MIRSKIKKIGVILIVLSFLLIIFAIASVAQNTNYKYDDGDPDDPDVNPGDIEGYAHVPSQSGRNPFDIKIYGDPDDLL